MYLDQGAKTILDHDRIPICSPYSWPLLQTLHRSHGVF